MVTTSVDEQKRIIMRRTVIPAVPAFELVACLKIVTSGLACGQHVAMTVKIFDL